MSVFSVATRFGTFFGTSNFGVFGTNFSVSAPRLSVSAPPSDIALSICITRKGEQSRLQFSNTREISFLSASYNKVGYALSC